MITNPNCDGGLGCTAVDSMVRRLPTSSDGAVIVCKNHFNQELWHRKMLNNRAGKQLFETPAWESLLIYWAKE